MHRARGSSVALAVTVVATATFLVAGRSDRLGVRLVPLAVALTAYGTLVVLLRRGAAAPDRRLAHGAVGVLLGLAVAVPPLHSNDVYLYAMQGRIAAVHGDSPYTAEPRDYPDDPLLAHVARPFRDGGSNYGPAFTVVEAGVAATVGPHPLLARLAFQVLAAGGLAGALVLLRRVDGAVAPTLFLGLNPVVLAKGVNEGHVDVILGLLLLGAVLLARRSRPAAAAALVGVAALVKPFALVAGLGIVAWLLLRTGGRTAVRAAAAMAAVPVLGYLAAGGLDAVRPLREAGLHQSRGSIWAQPRRLVTEAILAGSDVSGTDAGRDARELVGALAAVTVAVVALVAVVAVLRTPAARTAPDPALAVTVAFLAYLLASPYAPVWYVAAAVPTAALAWRSRTALAVVALGGVLALAYLYSPHLGEDPLAPALRTTTTWAVPALQLLAVLAIVAHAARLLARSGRVGPPRSIA